MVFKTTLISLSLLSFNSISIVGCAPTTTNKENQKLDYFKYDDQKFLVEKDGLYLVNDNHLEGDFWSGGKTWGTKVENSVVPMLSNTSYHVGISLFKNTNSFYFLYNDDDHDGYSIKDFVENLYLYDTNLIGTNKFEEINQNLSKTKKEGFRTLIPFEATSKTKGQLKRYYGEQVKLGQDQNWDQQFQNYLDHETSLESKQAAADFWKVNLTPNQNGQFENLGRGGASKMWYPIVGTNGYFTYEITHLNAVKVTYHKTTNKKYIEAQFVLKSTKSTTSAIYSVVVGGEDRHNDYLNHASQDYEYRFLQKGQGQSNLVRKIGDSYDRKIARNSDWLGRQFDRNSKFTNFVLNQIEGQNWIVEKLPLVDRFMLKHGSSTYFLEKFESKWVLVNPSQQIVNLKIEEIKTYLVT